MKEEIEQHPREPQKDVQQRRTTDRGTDIGTSEPGMPPRTDAGPDDMERSGRMGPPGTTQVDESLEAAPSEDSPAREPTERVERIEDASSPDDVERAQP